MLSGGITEAILGLTNAPLDATAPMIDGTSRAGEILEPRQQFLSSTTPGTAMMDRVTRAREKLEFFVGSSYEHLLEEIARGSGEHLVFLADLSGVPPDRRPLFQEIMHNAYSEIVRESLPAREAKLRLVNAAWAEGFGKLEPDSIKHTKRPGISDSILKLGKPRNSAALYAG